MAPLAVVAVALAALIVVSGSSVDEGDGGGNPAGISSGATDVSDAEATGPSGKKRYTVKPGDTLIAISEQTGVPVEQLQALNPDIDPQALSSGQRLKLR